jgi:hypothetical protein
MMLDDGVLTVFPDKPKHDTEPTTEDLCAEYVRLDSERRRHEDEAKALKDRADAIQEQLMGRFMERSLAQVCVRTCAGRATVYLRRDLWATKPEGVTAADVCAALKATGHGDFVSEHYNVNTLSAWVREFDRDDRDVPILPDGLRDVISVTEKYSLRVARS